MVTVEAIVTFEELMRTPNCRRASVTSHFSPVVVVDSHGSPRGMKEHFSPGAHLMTCFPGARNNARLSSLMKAICLCACIQHE